MALKPPAFFPAPSSRAAPPPHAADLTAYYGIAPSILRALLDLWLQQLHPLAPIERTVFLDVGAGKGRAMLVASEYPFLRVEGVELNPKLADIARRNICPLGEHAAIHNARPTRAA